MGKMQMCLVFACVSLVCCVSVQALTCTDNVCALVRCAYVAPDSCAAGTVFVKGGGFCGCCDACHTLVRAGETCPPRDSLIDHGHWRCQDGFYCGPSKTCEYALIVG